MRSTPNVKVAVAQFAPCVLDTPATLQKIEKILEEAAASGCGIVTFPEAFIPCYPRGLSFGSVVGWRKDRNPDFQRFFENAVELPGPVSDRLGRLAKKNRLYLNMGLVERDGGTLYCSLAYYGPDGTLLGVHRKLCATTSERILWGYGDGSHLQVVGTPWGRMTGAICWENRMPLLRAALYAKKPSIYLAPTADFRESWQCTARHIAMESRCFVLSCNQFLTKSMYPDDLACRDDLAELPEVLTRGGSAVIDPFGEYVAGPLYDCEGLVTAELDVALVTQSLFDFDPNGHYARPDVFRLQVDETAREGVSFSEKKKA